MSGLISTLRTLAAGSGKLSTRLNAMTVDVEEYFTVQNLDGVVPRERWPAQSMRVDIETRRLLDLFDRHSVKATFFVLGWVAERHRELVREIHDRGHEVAAHSYWHKLVFEMTPSEFREDLLKVKTILEDTIGAPVRGYRAPTYSITKKSLWAHEILVELGFEYSSSIFPIVHDRYGIPDYARFPQKLTIAGKQLWEFPLTTVRVAGKNLPIAGGGYLRLFPVRSVALAVAHVNEREKQPAIIYMHPWEIDPEIPKFKQGFLRDTRGYIGLSGMMSKLDNLLTWFEFGTVERVLREMS
jgi:polysaccharide deacetylase family protein (PEP-CTERM system associated)